MTLTSLGLQVMTWSMGAISPDLMKLATFSFVLLGVLVMALSISSNSNVVASLTTVFVTLPAKCADLQTKKKLYLIDLDKKVL